MTEMIHSFRYTPKFLNNPTIAPRALLYELYHHNQENLIVVKEIASNEHYHCLITTTIPIQTIRSRLKVKYEPHKDNYYLKKQKPEEEELEKAYRYLYKGENSMTLPVVPISFHTKEQIEEYHKQYWEIFEKLKDTTTNVEKCYQYLKSTFQDQLPSMSRPMLATEITLSRMRKQKPPMPRHSLITFLEYIEFRIDEEYGGQDLQQSILHYFTNQDL